MAKRVTAEGPVDGHWALPTGWRWERLGSVASTVGGGRLKFNKSHYVESGYPAYSAAGQDGLLDRWEFDGEAVVLSSIGARCGKSFYAKGRWASLANTQCIIPNSELNARYLWYYTNNEERWEKSGSAQPFIKPSTIKSLSIPLPSLEIQRRIVARIDELFAEVDDGEAALVRARDDLVTWRMALLKAAVTGELTADWRVANPPAETGSELLERILAERRARWDAEPRNAGKRYKEPPAAETSSLPMLPAGWSWVSLAQIAFVSGGLTVDAKRKPVDPVDVPYMRVANVQRGHLDLSVMKVVTIDRSAVGALSLAAGDILLNEGGDRDKIGRGWVYEGQLPICLHQNHVFKARPAHSAVSPFLVSMYLNELGRRFFIDQGKQTTNLASISLSKVSTAPIPIPPAAEAAEILRVYGGQSLPGAGVDMDDMRTAAATLRQSILAAAFRGDLA